MKLGSLGRKEREDLMLELPPRERRGLRRESAKEEKGRHLADGNFIRRDKRLVVSMDISTRGRMGLDVLILESGKILNHLRKEVNGGMSKMNNFIAREVSIPPEWLLLRGAINREFAPAKEFDGERFEKIDSLRKGDIAKLRGLVADKLQIQKHGFMPSGVSELMKGILSRPPRGPIQEELRKQHRRATPLRPLSTRDKGNPLEGKPKLRRDIEGMPTVNGICLHVSSRLIGGKGQNRNILNGEGRLSLFFRGIELPLCKFPKGKELNSPFLNSSPRSLGFRREGDAKEKATPRGRRPGGVVADS